MSQISDDCFAFGGPLMTYADAVAEIVARTPAVTNRISLPLQAAGGHVLTADAVARNDSPPGDNAAVDGYAFRHGDLPTDAPGHFPIAARIQAGDAPPPPLAPGTAARIFTGGLIPDGADTVVMQEDVQTGGSQVSIPPGLKAGANRRRAGEDIRRDTTLLTAGHRLGPGELALLAAGGVGMVEVQARPRVTILSTGDEIVPPGVPVAPGRVADANGPMLVALLQRLSITVRHAGIVPDRPDALRAALARAAADSDLILTSGGVSTGEADHVRTIVAELGALHLWRLAIKPGRPLAFGHVRGRAFCALPGNPVAVMACFLMFVRPLLDRLEGAAPRTLRRWPVQAGFAMRSKPDRREWLRGHLTAADNGMLTATRYDRQGSGIIHSLTESDGLIEVPENVTEIAPGDLLGFISFREAMA